MSAELAVQIAIRARLSGAAEVIALVPVDAILDVNKRPAPTPSIILGESQSIDEGDSIARTRERVFHTIHVWKREPSLEGVKVICAAVRRALRLGRLDLGPGYHAADVKVTSTRQMRDPDGETSHGVVVVEVLAQEVPS